MALQPTSLDLPRLKMTHFTKERFQSQAAFSGVEKVVEYVANFKNMTYVGMEQDNACIRVG